MEKNVKWILIILLLVGAVLIFANFQKVFPKAPQIQINQDTGETSTGGVLSYRMYDSDKNLIKPTSTLSVVDGTPGVSYIDLIATARNTGNYPLSCTPVAGLVRPSPYATAQTDMATKNSLVGSLASWTSGLITTSSLEALPQPDIFNITIRCTYNNGSGVTTLPDVMGLLSISILAESVGSGSYTVQINKGGVPTEYCGNNNCESANGEDFTTCPNDCVTYSYVKFRTSDPTYALGGAIAYSISDASCSGIHPNMTQYGQSGATGVLTGTCAGASKTWCGTSTAQVLAGLPGEWKVGGATPTLWKPTEANTLCVCDDGSDGKYQMLKYLSTDSDYTKVNNSSFSTGSNEVTC